MIYDILIRPKYVLIQYHCPMIHDMAIYRYIVASLTYIIHIRDGTILCITVCNAMRLE